MKSKKKLFELLNTYYGKTAFGLDHHMISDETYGKKNFIYITTPSQFDCRTLFKRLNTEGFKTSPNYHSKNGNIIEVQVSYFKGFHWDE